MQLLYTNDMKFYINGEPVKWETYNTVADDLFNLGIKHQFEDTNTSSNLIYDSEEY